MMPRRAPSFVALVVAVALEVGLARADGPIAAPAVTDSADAARQLDAEGRELFEKGRFMDAARTFERALERLPHAGTQYNAALSWDRAGQPARAADAFEAALGLGGLDETRARASERRLADLRRQLGYVTARRPIGALLTVQHVALRPLPTAFHLAPGRHAAQVTLRDGRVVATVIDVRAGQVVDLAVDPSDSKEAPLVPLGRSAGPMQSPAPAPSAAAGPRADTSPADEPGGLGPWPWVAVGGAAVFSGVAIALGVETLATRDDYVTNHPDDPEARADTVRLRNWTNAAWGAAIACGTLGAVLLLVDVSSRRSGPRAAPVTALREPLRLRF